MSEKIKISLAIPSYNEEGAIRNLLEEVKKYTAEYETEIIVVDSGSDNTAEIAREMGANVITQEPRGHGIALRTAINEAKNDIIITTDCDNTYPMDYIPKLVDLIHNKGYDLVSCNRLNKNLGKEMPFLNKLANMFFAFLVRFLFKINVHDVTTGMFGMSQKVNKSIKWETNYTFPCEIIIKSNLNNFKHKEIDIPYNFRIGNVTLNKWRSGKAYLKFIIKYRFNTVR